MRGAIACPTRSLRASTDAGRRSPARPRTVCGRAPTTLGAGSAPAPRRWGAARRAGRRCTAPVSASAVGVYCAGRIDEAAIAVYAKVPLMRFEFQEGSGMAIRKEVLRRRGAIVNAGIRAPGGALDAKTIEALDRVMKWSDVMMS